MDFQIISPREISLYLSRPGNILIDLRDAEEYIEGHIPKAINIPFEEIKNNYDFLKRFNLVILYCDRGNQSMIEARELVKQGITPIEVCGGMMAYRGPIER